MSIISLNENLFKKITTINFNNYSENITYKIEEDCAFIHSNNDIVERNMNNYSKHFETRTRTYLQNKKQFHFLENLFSKIQFPKIQFFKVKVVLKKAMHPKSNHLFIIKIERNKKLKMVTINLNSLINPKATSPSEFKINKSKILSIKNEDILHCPKSLDFKNNEKITSGYLAKNKNFGKEFFI